MDQCRHMQAEVASSDRDFLHDNNQWRRKSCCVERWLAKIHSKHDRELRIVHDIAATACKLG